MKKVLLPFIAACACAAPAFADEVYGTSPETAKPFPASGWLVESLETAPAEAWFTIESTLATPAQWGDVPSVSNEDHVIFVYLCDGGQEALQRAEGSNSYVLFPGQKYLVKITPKAVGFYGSFAPLAFPPAWEGQYKYYPKDITNDQAGLTYSQSPNTTAWYLYKAPYASQLTLTAAPNYNNLFSDVAEIQTIHIECPGGTNTGSMVMGPYIKPGLNVVGITAATGALGDQDGVLRYALSLNAITQLNCGNRLLYSASMKLGAKETYPDAYYTVDRYFEVPSDGTYTFTNHGAAGTILNIGSVKRLPVDPDEQYPGRPHECDWSNIKSATVGNSDAVITVDNLKAGDLVLVQSDAFGVIGEGVENLPYLMVTKGGDSAIDNIVADADGLKVNVAGSNLNVESVLLASGAEVAVYDMLARKVASAVAPAGAASLDMNLDVAPGVYVVVVYGKGNSESAKIAVK